LFLSRLSSPFWLSLSLSLVLSRLVLSRLFSPFLSFFSAFYRRFWCGFYPSPQDTDPCVEIRTLGLCVLVGSGHQQSGHCWTVGGGFFSYLVPRGGGGKLAGMGLNGKPLGQDLD